MSAWAVFFSWPAGGVWSNVIAAPITGLAVWLYQRRKLVSLHRKMDALHDKHDRLHELVARGDGRKDEPGG